MDKKLFIENPKNATLPREILFEVGGHGPSAISSEGDV